MSFHAYRTKPFEHTHENRAFNDLYVLLEQRYAKETEPVYLLGNVYANNTEIDAVVLKCNAVIVIDFKNYGGEIHFSENGVWKADDVPVKGGAQVNPYLQLRANRLEMLEYLKDITFSMNPKNHVVCLCLFQQNIQFDIQTLPPKIKPWFHVQDYRNAIRNIDEITNKNTRFTEQDLNLIIKKLEIPAYRLEGRAAEVRFADGDSEAVSEAAVVLNNTQSQALKNIRMWLDDEASKVFFLKGADNTGTIKILQTLQQKNTDTRCLARNMRTKERYENNGINNVDSIYQFLYGNRKIDTENLKETYQVKYKEIYDFLHQTNIDGTPKKQPLIVILDGHLFADEHYESDFTVYGSGWLVRDLLRALSVRKVNPSEEEINVLENKRNEEETVDFSDFPKILIIGDPYQLLRGGKRNNLVYGSIFAENKISSEAFELNAQDREAGSYAEMLDFQKPLIEQIKTERFLRLPRPQQGVIRQIQKGEKTDEIIDRLLHFPREAAILCGKNEQAAKTNLAIRKKYLQAESAMALVCGDIVELLNKSVDEKRNAIEGGYVDLYPHRFYKVMDAGRYFEQSISLKGRDYPTVVRFGVADICDENEQEYKILYLPEALSGAELTADQKIALRIFAEQDVKQHNPEIRHLEQKADRLKAERDSLEKDSEEYKEKDNEYQDVNKNYREQLVKAVLENRYMNAARLKFAYAMTVHRAMQGEPLHTVILDASAAHDTETPATDSYFRFIYSTTTVAAESLLLLNYHELNEWSKTEWNIKSAVVAPFTAQKRFHFLQSRQPTDFERNMPFPTGFHPHTPQQWALLLAVNDILADSGWHIDNITQHQYKERYVFSHSDGIIELDFNYNGKFEVNVEASKVVRGNDELVLQLLDLLRASQPEFQNNIQEAYSVFKDRAVEKGWQIYSIYESNFKLHVVLQTMNEKVGLELNIPNDSKKGLISSVQVKKADSQKILDKFIGDFCDGTE